MWFLSHALNFLSWQQERLEYKEQEEREKNRRKELWVELRDQDKQVNGNFHLLVHRFLCCTNSTILKRKSKRKRKKYTEHKILLLTNWRTSEHICRNMSTQEIWLLFYQEEIFPCCCFSSSSFFPLKGNKRKTFINTMFVISFLLNAYNVFSAFFQKTMRYVLTLFCFMRMVWLLRYFDSS